MVESEFCLTGKWIRIFDNSVRKFGAFIVLQGIVLGEVRAGIYAVRKWVDSKPNGSWGAVYLFSVADCVEKCEIIRPEEFQLFGGCMSEAVGVSGTDPRDPAIPDTRPKKLNPKEYFDDGEPY